MPASSGRGTAQYTSVHQVVSTPVQTAGRNPQPPAGSALLGSQARDVDVSASSFRNLLIGGGSTGLLTVLCAAALVDQGSGLWLWVWQIFFAALFLWFLAGSRGALASRGFLIDRSGLYVRSRGEVIGVSWDEISAVGVGDQPWIHNRRPTNPERQQAIEFFPADGAFPDRHPELDRWLIEEPPPRQGLPTIRYRFHIPPLSGVPKAIERAMEPIAPRKWLGHYKREPLPPRV